MSKIHAVRIINLNYNHNAIRIDDELWTLNGSHTLFSLRNGGGKSVLVQMLTAPFVHKQYLNTKERPFASYFTTNKPTFLLIEWQLDNQAGYVLTGLMVRRHQKTEDEEQEQDELDLVHFISEYQAGSPCDIRNFPVISQEKNGRKLKSYKACLDLFSTWKEDKTLQFFVYDQNIQGQYRAYFQKLEEYQIYYKEWETIIKKINNKESGLSELFADTKSERQLIEKWFLPEIATKLNQDENRVKGFQRLMLQYVSQYKNNQDKIGQKQVIQQFLQESETLQQAAECSVQQEEQKQKLANRIAHFMADLSQQQAETEQQLAQAREELEQLMAAAKSIAYDRHSWNLYQLQEQQTVQQQQLGRWEEQEQRHAEILRQLEQKLHIQECARRYLEWCDASQTVQELESQLELLHQDMQSKEPEREQLGYSLRHFYSNALQQQEEALTQTEQRLQELETQMQQLKKDLQQQRQRQQQLGQKQAGLQEQLRQYDRQEAAYNQKYQQQFARNLLGQYEAGFLELQLQQETQQNKNLQIQLTALGKEKEEAQQQRHVISRQQSDNTERLGRLRTQLLTAEEQLASFEQELEVRRTLAAHVNFDSAAILEKQELLAVFQQRIELLLEELRVLRNQQEQEKGQMLRLQTGQMLELPGDLAEALHDLGIHYTTGMEWLKRAELSVQEKQALTQSNQFIPYSLVMSKKELQRLEHSRLTITTAFPVPIVPWEALTAAAETRQDTLQLHGQVGFYVLFDQRLLDETGLQQVLAVYQKRLEQLAEKHHQRQEELRFFQEKADLLKKQQADRKAYETVQNNIKQLQEQTRAAEELSHELRNRFGQLEHTIETLGETMRQNAVQQKLQEQKLLDLQNLFAAYGQNQEQRRQLDRLATTLQEIEKSLTANEYQQRDLEQLRQNLQDQRRDGQNQAQKLQEQLHEFSQYQPRPLIQRDLEDLLSRYRAITRQVSAQQQDLEQQLHKAKERHDRIDTDLQHYSQSCNLVFDMYAAVSYDRYIVEELQQQQKRQKEEDKQIQEEQNKCRIELGILQNRIEGSLKAMEEKLGYAAPRPKEEILVIDFDLALAQKEQQEQQCRQTINNIAARLALYQNQLESLSEYDTLEITAPWEDAPKLFRMDREDISRLRGGLIRDYQKAISDCHQAVSYLENLTREISGQSCYQEEFFAAPFHGLASLTSMPEEYLLQLHTTIASYQSILEQLKVDLALLEQEKETIQEIFFRYTVDVHQQMGMIDRNSTIRVRERTLKMLKIILPDWKDNEVLYKAKLQRYLDDVIKQCLAALEANQNIENILSSRINAKELYDAVIGINNIDIRLYKIEEQQEYPIPWSDVAKNSGGEGFLSAFIILSSLLSFLRYQESDLFREREEGKVLLMDNPFAQTNAAHLLVPMMDIARRTNIQLICLSGLGGDSIYSRFDNIYVLTLTASGLHQGVEYLRGEQIKGVEEPAEHMQSAHIQTEPMEQITLF